MLTKVINILIALTLTIYAIYGIVVGEIVVGSRNSGGVAYGVGAYICASGYILWAISFYLQSRIYPIIDKPPQVASPAQQDKEVEFWIWMEKWDKYSLMSTRMQRASIILFFAGIALMVSGLVVSDKFVS